MSFLFSFVNWTRSKIQSVEHDYQERSPRGKWDILRKTANYLLGVIGLAVLDRKFKVWYWSYLPGMLGVDYPILAVYTMWKFRNEPLIAFQTTCLYGLLIPVGISNCIHTVE